MIQVTNDLVSTNNYNELGTALIIAEQGIAGYWTWRPTTLKDTEKATGIEQGILLNLSPKAQPITAVQFKFGVSYIGWPYTEALQNQFTFGDSDYDYDFAKQHNMEVGGHMLIWGFDTPDWVRQKSNSPDILRQIMINHIDQIVGQYKGRTNYWVVVNEAGAKSQSSGYSDVFLNSLGEQYIFDAFQEVREKDPSAKLVYGDYLNYFNKDESRKIFIIDLVLKLKQRGLIDALGLQIYGRMDNKDLLEKLKIDLHDLRQLGIPIYINEFSVVMLRESSQESMLTQAEVTKKIIITLKESGIVTKIVHWGLSDDLTNKISGNQANAGLFMLNGSTNQLVPKPNFFAILSTLNESNQ
ncbi:MAG: hypothetical protein DWB42_20855 [Chloroflexi bacterium]|nr:hypothetical protein [Chloroflexota bacterium]